MGPPQHPAVRAARGALAAGPRCRPPAHPRRMPGGGRGDRRSGANPGGRAAGGAAMKRPAILTAGIATVVAVAAIVWFRVLAVPAVETVTVSPVEFRAQAFGTGTVEARVYVEIGSKITGRV